MMTTSKCVDLIISYTTPYEAHLKIKGLLLSKPLEKNVKSQRGIFQISHKPLIYASRKAAYSEHTLYIHSISMAGYVTAVLAFIRDEVRARRRAVSVIFEKLPLAISLRFIKKKLLKSKLLYCEMCLVRRTIA